MKGLIFVYLLTYGGFFASLVRPWYGLLIYVCFSILRPDFLWYWSVPQGPYAKIIAIGLICGWVINGLGTWDLRGARWATLCLLMFWVSIVFSMFNAPHQEVAWAYFEQFTKILLPLIIGITLIDTEARLRQLAWVWLLSLGFVAYEANLDYFLGGTRLRVVGFFGIDNNCSCVALVTAVGLSFFLGLAEKVWWKRGLAWVISAMLAHCPMFGDSRGGMLGLLAVGAVTFYLIPKRPQTIAIYALGSVAALSLAGPSVWERFGTVFATGEARDTSAQSRMDLWRDCWELMMQYPFFGYGPDHFPYAARDLFKWRYLKEAHMLWLGIGAELGFAGMLSLFSYYTVVAWQLFVRVRQRRMASEWQTFAAQGTVAALVGFIVSACFVAIDALEPPYFIAMFGAGLVRVADRAGTVAHLPNNPWATELPYSVSFPTYGTKSTF